MFCTLIQQQDSFRLGLRPFSWKMRKSLKTCAIEQILLYNNMVKVNNKHTKIRCEISPSLTTKTIKSLTQCLGLYC